MKAKKEKEFLLIEICDPPISTKEISFPFVFNKPLISRISTNLIRENHSHVQQHIFVLIGVLRRNLKCSIL